MDRQTQALISWQTGQRLEQDLRGPEQGMSSSRHSQQGGGTDRSTTLHILGEQPNPHRNEAGATTCPLGSPDGSGHLECSLGPGIIRTAILSS